MSSLLRRILFRLGLTGKLLVHVGWILALSLGLLAGLAGWGGRRAIRAELEKTEKVRLLDWASRHLELLESENRWELAKEIEELDRDPYVLFAGIYDRQGKLMARTGDSGADSRSHTLHLFVELRTGLIRQYASSPPVSRPLPLPGTVAHGAAEPGAAFRDGFGSVLADLGKRSEDLVGFAEVTLDTAPLDALAWGVLGPVVLAAALLFLGGLGATWLLVRSVTSPLRMLRARADRLAAGETDLHFHEVPRPADEVGILATQLSVMAATLERSRASLEEHVRLRETALANEGERVRKIAHDLRNPLSSILAFAEILEDESHKEPERRAFLDRIRSEAQRLECVVARLEEGDEAGQGTPARRPLSVILVVSGDAGLRGIVRGVLERDGLRVSEAADPPEARGRLGEGLPDAILLDLFMEGGAAFEVMLDIRSAASGGREVPILALAVLRDGDRFEAADVHFRSKPVPREDLLAAAHAASGGDRPRRVLIVDDDRFLAEGIRSILASGGFQAESTEAGEEALRTAARNPPGLVVLDLGLPDLDGIEVLRRLRGRPETRRTPVILLTGHAIPAGSSVAWSESVLGPQTFAAGIRAALKSVAGG